jgi:hypothetical protein
VVRGGEEAYSKALVNEGGVGLYEGMPRGLAPMLIGTEAAEVIGVVLVPGTRCAAECRVPRVSGAAKGSRVDGEGGLNARIGEELDSGKCEVLAGAEVEGDGPGA